MRALKQIYLTGYNRGPGKKSHRRQRRLAGSISPETHNRYLRHRPETRRHLKDGVNGIDDNGRCSHITMDAPVYSHFKRRTTANLYSVVRVFLARTGAEDKPDDFFLSHKGLADLLHPGDPPGVTTPRRVLIFFRAITGRILSTVFTFCHPEKAASMSMDSLKPTWQIWPC